MPEDPVQEISQFTPDQLLDAGRRAEADGRADIAVQFYAHVATQHSGSAVAAAAVEALQRLDGNGANARSVQSPVGPPPPQPPTPPMAVHQHGLGPAHQMYGNQIYANQSPEYSAASAYAQNSVSQQFANIGSGPSQRPTVSRPQWPLAVSREPEPARAATDRRRRTRDEIAPPGDIARPSRHVSTRADPKRYRLGRTMAQLLGIAGSLALIGGLVSFGSVMVLSIMKSNNALLMMMTTSPIVVLSLVVCGSVFILLSQMAQAVFDAALARRDYGPPYDDDE